MPNPKHLIKQLANSRIYFLFNRAHEVFPENRYLANRYIFLARKYAQRARININSNWKRRICHNCKMFLYPGINCIIRMQSRKGRGSHISQTCLECNKTTRYYIKTKKFKKT